MVGKAVQRVKELEAAEQLLQEVLQSEARAFSREKAGFKLVLRCFKMF